MLSRHVNQLLVRFVHGQLSSAQRARVINHVRGCDHCRAALAREERLAGDLRREMPRLGQPTTGQLSTVWAGVWQEIYATRGSRRPAPGAWLPGLSMVVAVMLAVLIVAPVLRDGGLRVEAAPALPLATSSPTPGAAETGAAQVASAEPETPEPGATLALAAVAGATPAPVPAATVSPEAPGGGRWR